MEILYTVFIPKLLKEPCRAFLCCPNILGQFKVTPSVFILSYLQDPVCSFITSGRLCVLLFAYASEA